MEKPVLDIACHIPMSHLPGVFQTIANPWGPSSSLAELEGPGVDTPVEDRRGAKNKSENVQGKYTSRIHSQIGSHFLIENTPTSKIKVTYPQANRQYPHVIQDPGLMLD